MPDSKLFLYNKNRGAHLKYILHNQIKNEILSQRSKAKFKATKSRPNSRGHRTQAGSVDLETNSVEGSQIPASCLQTYDGIPNHHTTREKAKFSPRGA
jgi:hypothetical protein